MLLDGGNEIVPNLGAADLFAHLFHHIHDQHGMLLILCIERHELQDAVNHLGGADAVSVDRDSLARHRHGWIEVISDNDEISVSHFGKSLQEIRSDAFWYSFQH